MTMTSVKLIAGSSHPKLASKVAQHLGIELTPIEIVQHSGQEASVTIKDCVYDEDVFILQSSAGNVNDNLIELLQLLHACRAARARRITAILPDYPYARQDKSSKLRHGPMKARTAELVAVMLQAAGCNHIITMDLHNPQIQEFFDVPVHHLSADSWMLEWIRANLYEPNSADDIKIEHVVVSPDAGGTQRAKSIADSLGLPLATCHKERKEHRDVTSMILAGDDDRNVVSGKVAIIIDDMADTCGTLVKAADLLMQHGAVSVMAVVTHGIFGGLDPVSKLNQSAITKVVVTNSVPAAVWKAEGSTKFHVVDVSKLLAEACLEVHHDRSGESACTPASIRFNLRTGNAADILVEYAWPTLLTVLLAAFYCWLAWMGLGWWFEKRVLLR